MKITTRCTWIDLDKSPQVPLFLTIARPCGVWASRLQSRRARLLPERPCRVPDRAATDGFRWSASNRTTIGCCLMLAVAVFGAFHWLPSKAALAIGSLAVLASVVCSARILTKLAAPDRLPRSLIKLLGRHAGG